MQQGSRKGPDMSNYSESSSIRSKQESVRVSLRIRPMNDLEIQRGDENCINMLAKN